MRIKLALAKRDAALLRLKDLYSSAEHFSLPNATINDRYNAVLASVAKCPEWVRVYLDGYRAALNDQLYRQHLVFGGFVDGVFYSTHSSRDDYYEKHGVEPRDYADNGRVLQRGHYWAKTLRPYFNA